MKAKVIYSDENMKIGIQIGFHEALVGATSPLIPLTKQHKIVLMGMVRKWLFEQGHITDKTKFSISGLAPLLEPGTELFFDQPFDIFTTALNWLTTYNTLDNPDEYQQIVDEISGLYPPTENENEYLQVAIFHEELFGIKGYCAHIIDDECLILFWGFNDLIIEDFEVE